MLNQTKTYCINKFQYGEPAIANWSSTDREAIGSHYGCPTGAIVTVGAYLQDDFNHRVEVITPSGEHIYIMESELMKYVPKQVTGDMF